MEVKDPVLGKKQCKSEAFLRWSILQLIKLYQRLVSPHLPTSCRFHPTCSRYAAECFEQYSFFKASKMVLFRLGKCHPFHPGGFDPVPKR